MLLTISSSIFVVGWAIGLPIFTLHYIRTIYSGLSKDNCKDHYGDLAIEQCLGMIAEINEFSVFGEM